jgi:PAS domain S-box-containing protein
MCGKSAESDRPLETCQKLVAEQKAQIEQLEENLQKERELRRSLEAQLQTHITDRTQTAAVPENQQFIQKIAGAIPGIIYIYDVSENCNIYTNDRTSKILSYTPEKIKQLGTKLFATIMHPDDLAKVPGNMEKLAKYKDNQIFEWEYRLRNASGESRWFISRDTVFSINSDGTPKHLLGRALDITHRKRAASERNGLIASLEKSQEMYRTLIKYYPNGWVFLFDRDLRYSLVGGQGLAAAGLDKEQLEGKTLQEVAPPEDVQLFESKYRAALAGKENNFECKQGDRIYSVTVAPVKNDREEIFAGMVVAQEIAEQKQADWGLQRLKNALEIKFQKQSAVLKASNQQLREEMIEHWRAEESLRESQQQLELFFCQSLDGFFFMMLEEPVQWDDTVDKEKVLDCVFASARVTKANDAWLAQYGAAREEFIGLPLNYFFARDMTRGRELIKQFFDGGRIHIESDDRKFDGTQMWVEGDYICIYDSQGRIRGHFGVQRDISDRKKAEAALRDSEERFRATVEQAAVGITHPDITGRYLRVNQKFCEIVGYTASELLSLTWMDVSYPEDIEADLELNKQLFAGEIDSFQMEKRLVRKNGTLVWVNITVSLIKEPLSGAIYNLVVTEDISDRKSAEAALKASEERFRQLAESIQDSFWLVTAELNDILYLSPAYEQIWGRSHQELYANGCNWIEWVHPEDKHLLLSALPRLLAGNSTSTEYRILRPDGTIRWVCDRAFPIVDESGKVYRIAGICEDISDRKLTEVRIQAALREKEILLKEIHHRVKNNMQVISSLLQLQAQYIEDEHTLSLFEESQTRIHSMALIHEQLYQSEHLDRIDLQPYVENLVANLSQSFGCYSSSIRINLNVDPISLNIETAIPCGLIVNELASNSLKYAFTNGRKGEISIDFRQISDRQFQLSIKDNGTGFPDGFDVENTETLGLRLVRMLTTQLDGTLAIDSQCGTCYDIKFKELNYRRRI